MFTFERARARRFKTCCFATRASCTRFASCVCWARLRTESGSACLLPLPLLLLLLLRPRPLPALVLDHRPCHCLLMQVMSSYTLIFVMMMFPAILVLIIIVVSVVRARRRGASHLRGGAARGDASRCERRDCARMDGRLRAPPASADFTAAAAAAQRAGRPA